MHIAISFENEMKAEALKLSQANAISLYPRYSAPNTTSKPLSSLSPPDFLLHLTPSHLELRVTQDSTLTPLSIDFLSGKNRHRRLYGGGKGQQLAKAVGLNKYSNPTIIDTTAGLGRDAFVLATLGCEVTLIERTTPVYLLLKDALSRASETSEATLSIDPEVETIIKRMTLHHTDSLSFLSNLKQEHYPDVIYIDPMFPPRGKSAKVKKEMALFHQLVGQDNDAEKIVETALTRALKRIVVKRPRLAESLYPKPAFQITGKSTRYDVYLPR